MDRTTQNHLLNYFMEKRYMKSKQSLTTEKGDKDTNITSNGGDTLSPMLPGNQNIHFLMMETYWHSTKSDTASDNLFFLSNQ